MSRHGRGATVDETVRDNMGLVSACIDKHFPHFARYGATREDALQMGAIGLAKAHDSYSPDKGSFSTHAFWQIRGALGTGMFRYGAITDPKQKHLDGRWNHKAISQFGRADDDGPAIEPHTSADDAPDELAGLNDQAAMIRSVLRELTPRYRTILRMRFMEGRTLEEVGEALGVSRGRIQQLEKPALLAARIALARNKTRRTRKPIPESRRAHRFTDEQRRAIVADYFDTGVTMAAVGRKWQLTTTSVYQIVAGPIAVRLFGREQASENAKRTKTKRNALVADWKRRVPVEEVRRLRERFMAGEVRVVDLASEYGVRRETIGCMLYGRGVYGLGVYACIPPVPAPGGKRRLTFAQAAEIRARYAAGGETMYTLAAKYGVSYTTVRFCLHGTSYQATPGKPGKRGVNAPSVIAAVNESLGLPTVATRSTAAFRRWRREQKAQRPEAVPA